MLHFLMCLLGLHGATEVDYTVEAEEIKVCRDCLKEIKQLSKLPDRLRYIKPRSICIIEGVFLFLLELTVTERIQAKRDSQFCCDELSKQQNLSRNGLRHSELIAMDNIMIHLKECIGNL